MKTACGWDDELKEDDLCEWCEWFKESEQLKTVQISRALFIRKDPFRETNLHAFCDTSQNVYRAWTSLRREFEVFECRLVAEKGRVAPLKARSICRLELMKALIAAHLTETQAAELVTKVEKITFWRSSYKAFVGNGVSEIHTIISNPETALGAGSGLLEIRANR